MAALGGVLSALLLLALITHSLVYKHYGHRLACGFGRALVGFGVGQGAKLGGPERVAKSEISRRQRRRWREQDGEPGSVRPAGSVGETEGGWWSAWGDKGAGARRVGWGCHKD